MIELDERGGFERRAVAEGDEEFLFLAYACSRDDVERAPWTAEQKTAFLRGQCEAQRAHYELNWPAAAHEVILVDGKPAGRIWYDLGERELRVMDIVMLPEYRGRGIGTHLLEEFKRLAAERGLEVGLSALREHPRIIAYYQRLGFEIVEDGDIYIQLAWKAGAKKL